MCRIIAAVAVFATVNVVHARSCIVDAGTQTYGVSSAESSTATITVSKTIDVKVSAATTETRRNTLALSNAGSLCTMTMGSVLILR